MGGGEYRSLKEGGEIMILKKIYIYNPCYQCERVYQSEQSLQRHQNNSCSGNERNNRFI